MLISCKKMTKEKREEEEKKSPTRYHARSKKKLVSLFLSLSACVNLVPMLYKNFPCLLFFVQKVFLFFIIIVSLNFIKVLSFNYYHYCH